MTNRSGQQFGNYRLIRHLGRGGFADVYLAEHVYLKTQTAIKILHTQLTQEDLEEFLQEAKTIAHLKHPNIVRVLDFGVGSVEDLPYLVMDYASNGTLRQSHPKGTIVPLVAVVSYVKQIAAALQYAHNEKLIHRDVKPENMLLGSNNEVLLSDFGIAAVAHSTSSLKTQAFSGTIHYSAPEQIKGKARPASDQYALAIVVYEWLTGIRPFSGSSHIGIAMQHLSDPPPPLHTKLSTISPAVEQIVLQALAKDPQQRFANVQEFAQELDQAYQIEQRTKISPLPPMRSPADILSLSSQLTIDIRPTSVAPVARPSTGTLLYTYQVPQREGYALSWTRRGHRIASSHATGKIEVRDVATGTLISTNTSHTTQVNVIVWSPDGSRIASCAPVENAIRVWDADNGNHIATYADADVEVTNWLYRKGVLRNPITWSPDSTCIAFTQKVDKAVQIWNVLTNRHILTSTRHSVVVAVAWSPDGTHIASLECNNQNASGVCTIQIWQANTESQVATCFLDKPGRELWHLDEQHIIWSPNSTHIVSYTAYTYHGTRKLSLRELDGDVDPVWYPEQIQIWQAATGRRVAFYRRAKVPAWSPDATRITFVSNGRALEVREVGGNIIAENGDHSAPVSAVAWSPNGTSIASASDDGIVEVWNAATGHNILTYKGHSSAVYAMMWSPNGTSIASESKDKTVQVWQAV